MPNFDRTLSNRLDQSFLTVDLTVAHRSTASHFLTFWLFGVKLPCEFGVSCDTIYFHYSSVIIERSVVQKESYPHQVMSWIEWHMWWIITIAFQFGRPCDASFIYHWLKLTTVNSQNVAKQNVGMPCWSINGMGES